MTGILPEYKRVVLKLSGEALSGPQKYGIDHLTLVDISRQIKELVNLKVDVAIVLGAGNIFRGVAASKKEGIDRATADYMGMLATIINGLALQDALEKEGVVTRVLTAIETRQLAELYIRRRAIRHLEKGRVVIFVGGTGNPYFTTDTAAALKAAEIDADVILKATKVDGVYSADPLTDKAARKFKKLSFMAVIKKGLKVMDTTAVSLCMENDIPIIVFNFTKSGNIKKVVLGQQIGTIVC